MMSCINFDSQLILRLFSIFHLFRNLEARFFDSECFCEDYVHN